MYKNILWIDPAVKDYMVFVDSVNTDTLALVYPEPLISGVERIGFVFEKHGPMATYLLANANVLIGLGVKHMDFLACDTLPEWKGFYDTLTGDKLTGITVGASNNMTGNLQYGGDWLMESTCEDVEAIYFTKSIQYYTYLLGDISSFIFKVENILWGIGDNTYNQLGFTNTGTLTTFVNISEKQTDEFKRRTIVMFNWVYRHTLVMMSDGTVWMAGYPNDQFDPPTNKQFVQVKLTIDNAGNKVLGTPILAKVGQMNYNVNSTGGYEKGTIWLVTQSGISYNLYIYSNIGYIDGSNFWPWVSSAYFQLSNNRWNPDVPSDKIIQIDLDVVSNIKIFTTTTNVYVSSISAVHNDKGSTGANPTPVPTYKLTRVTLPQKVTIASGNDIYFLENGFVITWDLSGYYKKCKSNDVEISGATHLESNKNFVAIVTNNVSVWTINAGFNSTVNREFTLYPINFGTIADIGIYNKGTTNTLLVRSGYTIYNANLTTTTSMSVISTLSNYIPGPTVNSITKTTAIINSSVNLLGSNFSTTNTSYLKIGITSVDISVLDSETIQFRVPNVVQTNSSIDLYTNFGARQVPYTFTILPLFNLTQYNPSSVIPQTQLQLFGSNFFDISYVKIGDQSVFPTTVTSTQINVSVPVGLADQVTVTVFDLYNNNASLTKLSILNMRVTTFAPPSAPKKSTIFLSGSNFSNLSTVRFGLVNASFTRVSETNLSVRVPDGIYRNSSISVWDIYGNNASYSTNFSDTTFTLTSFSPTSSILKTTIFLTGSNFSNLSMILFGSVPSLQFSWTSNNISVQVPDLSMNCLISINDIYGNIMTYPTTFTILDYYATCFFGYFKPTSSNTHQFNLSSDNLVQLRLGNKTLYDLRSTNTSLLQLNASTLLTSSSIQLTNTSYYPLLLTYVNTYPTNVANLSVTIRNTVKVGNNTATALLPFCTTDKTTPGLFCYNLNGEQLRQTTGLSWSPNYNASVLQQFDRIYSPTWAFGTLAQQTFWNDGNFSLVEGPVPTTPLNISTIQLANQILTIQGTGLHANVSVFLDNVLQTTFGTLNVSVLANFSQVRLADGFAQSSVYSTFNITSINVSTALRNSSVNLSGTALTNVSAITVGTANASFAILANKVEMRVPDSTQTLQPLTVYDKNGGTAIITSFTIPPLFTITGLNPSSLPQNASLTILGDNFSNMSYVIIGTTSAKLNLATTTSLNVSVPSGVVGNVSVTAVDIYNNRVFIDGLTSYPKLSVSSINPSVAVRGTPLTLTGLNFYNLSYLNTGGTKIFLPNFSYTTTAIQFAHTLTAPGNISIGVYDSFNNASLSFTLPSLFSVSSYTPSSVIPRNALQIRGSNFSNLSHVQFGSMPIPLTSFTTTLINVSVPNGLADVVSITVVDLYGNTSSIASNLSILNLKFTSVSPAVAVEGTPLTITGDNLSNVSYVLFGNLSNPPTSTSKTTVQVVVPTGVSQIDTFTLQDVYGNTLTSPFTTATLFSVSGFNPSSQKPQRALEITGANFSNLSYVKFGDKTQQPFQYTDTTLNVSLPAGLPSTVSVTVFNQFSTGRLVGNLSVLNLSINTVVPTATVKGQPLTITGTHFFDLSYVQLGSKVFLPNFSYTETQVTLITPATSGNLSLLVGDFYGNNTSISFVVNPVFTLTGYNLSSVIPQTLVQIRGANLSNLSKIQFGDTKMDPFEVALTYVNVSVPTGLNNTVPVTVLDLFGNTASLSNLSILNLSIGSWLSTAVQRAPLTLIGDNLSNASYVLFGTYAQQVLTKNKTTVTVKVPDDTNTSGYLTLYDIYQNNSSVPFTVKTLFTVTSLSTQNVVPNQPITITGTNFENLSYLMFGNVSTQSFTYSPTQINVSVPTNALGNVSVFVYDLFTNVKSLSNLNISAKLVLTSIQPSIAVKGTPLTLTGSNFYNLSYIQVAGTTLYQPFTYSVNQITFVQPTLTVGNTSMIVQDIYGNNTSLSFVVNPVFTLTGYNLSSVVPQTLVQIRGANFSNLSKIQFGDNKVDPFEVTPTYVNVSVPTGLANSVPVTVLDLFGNTASLSNLSILNLSIASIQPTLAVQRAPLTITGDNLSNASYVMFGSYAQPITTCSKTTVTVKVPENPTTPGYVTLYDIYNNNHSVPFSIQPLFTLTSFLPTSLVPNAPLTLTGTNLSNLSAVYFGEVRTTNFSYSDTTLQVSVPTNALGNVSVFVHDLYTNVKNLSDLNISAKLLLTSINTGVYGAPILLTGNHFYNVSVHVGGTLVNFSYDVTSIRFKNPLYAGNVSVGVYDPYGNNASISFVTQPLFSVTGYNLSVIPRRPLQITGTNFSNLSTVRLGSYPVYDFSYNSQSILLTVPMGLPDLVSVTVVDLYGNTSSMPANSSMNLSILNLKIASVSPAVAVQGTPLTILGDQLANVSYVVFGNISAPPSTVSKGVVTVTVPAGVTLINALSLLDVYGNTASISFATTALFSVSGFASSRVKPQRTLQIQGLNFSNLSYVQFGDKQVTSLQYTDSRINVSVPTGLAANVPVTVFNQFSTGLFVGNLSVLNLYVNAITPSVAVKGTPLTITGSNFYDLSYIQMETKLFLPNFSYNETTIQLNTPAITPGNVSVGIVDVDGNNASIGFRLRNLSYAFQVGNQLTLVGTGLAGLSPGFPTLYASDTAPMFTAPLLTGVRTVNLSENGYSTDTITVYPVTVIQANLATSNTDVISVRAMPTGKIPDNVYTV